jgi:hypothetical protein
MSETILNGACGCGKVRYQVPDAFKYAGNCYCSACRRATGSAFKPFAGIELSHFRRLADEADLLRIGTADGNHDIRCRHCGSLLYSVVRDGEWVHVSMGTLLDAPSIRAREHIFVGSKAPWYEINDDLPQYEGHASGPLLAR